MKRIFYMSKKIQYECREYLNGYLFWCSLGAFAYKKILPKYFRLFFQARRGRLEEHLDQRVISFLFGGKKAFVVGERKMRTYVLTYLAHVLFRSTFQFKKIIGLRGVGYKFLIYKNFLRVQVDYSHLLQTIFLPFYYGQFSRKLNWLRIRSSHVFSLTQDLASTKRLRRPDVYKGKGIRYAREINFYKQGKKKKSA